MCLDTDLDIANLKGYNSRFSAAVGKKQKNDLQALAVALKYSSNILSS